jgi:hypothetical protein
MKKTILFLFTIILIQSPVFAMNFGQYKPETDYGLIDGFKFNFLNRKDGQKLIEIRSETKEEQEKIEREKLKPPKPQDEMELFRFIREGVTPI